MHGAAPAVSCAICDRTLLVGETSVRFSSDGTAFVNVCPLCRDRAIAAGWYEEGGLSLPARSVERQRGFIARLFGSPARPPTAVDDPILHRLSPAEQTVVQAAALFNGSTHRRTIEGLIRSLGTPQAAITPSTGEEAVIVVFWDISWYRYSVVPGEFEPVQMLDRGFDIAELELGDDEVWSAEVDAGGRLSPAVVPS